MKITCTLSEYTKMARQCWDIKESGGCYKCPFYSIGDDEKDDCDIEHFVQTITMPGETTCKNAMSKPLEEPTMLNNHADDVPSGCIHVHVPRVRGEKLETR